MTNATVNIAAQYRKAGIKGMSESNGSVPAKKKIEYKSQYAIVPRLEDESLQDWKARCTKKSNEHVPHLLHGQ